MTHIQTQTEWEEEKGNQILDYVKGRLYTDFRYMGNALSGFTFQGNEGLTVFATNGVDLYYGPAHTIELFKKNELFLTRAYLHSVLHCIFAHLWIAGGRNRDIWHVACDIAVEYVIDHLNKPTTKRILTFKRMKIYDAMEKNHIISAAGIYGMLIEDYYELLPQLAQEFITDDHRFWPDEEQKQQSEFEQKQIQKEWEQRARQMQMEKERSGNDPDDGERAMMAAVKAQKNKRNYSEFLKKFSIRKEELKADPDEFDLSFYTYGLKHFGNMPLIEPVETKESKKIQEFVIALDTSYSTSSGLIQKFLNETATILMQENAYFTGSRIHVIQCDEKVQDYIEIKNLEQMKQFAEGFTIQGGGNTDFRPAFSYVNALMDEGIIRNLGGLLYFTDGRGIYPKQRPKYKTAFVYVEDYDEEQVPPWALRIRLNEDYDKV